MRGWICIILVLLAAPVQAQQYRLVYDESSLPELYTRIKVYAEELQGGHYKRLPERTYKLSCKEAQLTGSTLQYDRGTLYRQNGDLHVDLLKDGKSIPLILHLPVLTDIRYNLFTDSIKPVLNYYVNVEGVFSNGKIYPLDTSFVTIASSEGIMQGMEWIVPRTRHFEKVTFTTTTLYYPFLQKEVTLYLKRYNDPRDAPGYEDRNEEDIIRNRRRK